VPAPVRQAHVPSSTRSSGTATVRSGRQRRQLHGRCGPQPGAWRLPGQPPA
jgi:hypothetical protein